MTASDAHPHDHHHHICPHGSLAEHHPRSCAICLDQVSFSYEPGWAGRPSNGAVVTPKVTAASPGSMALRNVTLHIEHGCNLGIIGPNGAGKTTLIKILVGLLEGYRGRVSILGMTPREACQRGDVIGYVPQRVDVEWRFPLSVRQVVMMGLAGKTGLMRWYRRVDRAYAEQIMQRVGIAPLAERPIGDLSGGQQQRVFIARALVAQPRILIFDEPLVGVDKAGQQQFAHLIHELHEALKLTVVVVSHDIRAIAAGCNRVACLKQTIHYHDAPQGLTRQVLSEVFEHEIEPVLS